jgi:hypothetical protein
MSLVFSKEKVRKRSTKTIAMTTTMMTTTRRQIAAVGRRVVAG